MSLKNLSVAALVIILSTACGKAKKPMHLSGMDSLSTEQRALVETGISKFNEIMGENIVSESNSGYEIALSVHDQQLMNALAPGLDEDSVRNGYAEPENDHCSVKISSDLISETKQEILTTVIIHELGHCAGLEHVAEPGKIMSESPSAFKTYSAEVIAEFKTAIQTALKD